jgi:hypothetical protein
MGARPNWSRRTEHCSLCACTTLTLQGKSRACTVWLNKFSSSIPRGATPTHGVFVFSPFGLSAGPVLSSIESSCWRFRFEPGVGGHRNVGAYPARNMCTCISVPSARMYECVPMECAYQLHNKPMEYVSASKSSVESIAYYLAYQSLPLNGMHWHSTFMTCQYIYKYAPANVCHCTARTITCARVGVSGRLGLGRAGPTRASVCMPVERSRPTRGLRLLGPCCGQRRVTTSCSTIEMWDKMATVCTSATYSPRWATRPRGAPHNSAGKENTMHCSDDSDALFAAMRQGPTTAP